MTLLQLQGIGKSFGGRSIFRDLDWALEEGTRTGLVGPNGAGKSTILKIAAGLEETDRGQISRRRGLVTAYLPQHIAPDPRPAIQVVVQARSEIAAVEAELASIETALGTPAVAGDLRRIERLLQQQERALEKLDAMGYAGIEGEARSKLTELGLSREDQEKPLAHLSGGQRKLVHLVACLIRRPDLLLLDEPETHLDLRARSRLEHFIRAFEGAVVIVSHDRYLLDETVTQIAQLETGRLSLWPGNYSAYAVARELELRRQEVLYTTQEKEIERLEDAIRRFKQWASEMPDGADNSRHIKQARNKQRQIDSMDKVERPVLERRKIRLSLHEARRSGQKVIEMQRVSVSLSARRLLSDVSVQVYRGDRVGVIGGNGAGKTVLMRTITEEIAPETGSVWLGPSVELGYFRQNPESDGAAPTPVDALRQVRPMREDEAVAQLMKFLFTYEQTRQPVEKLSGGERSRLQLLTLMLGQANLLILDEPTNHLDIDSMEVLESSLEKYEGTVIVVSHDRYFLDRMVDKIVEVKNGIVVVHPGGYSDWLTQAGM